MRQTYIRSFPKNEKNPHHIPADENRPFKDFGIVIVNRDLKNDTAECIDSLMGAGAALEDILVVDNGSKDDSVAFLRKRFGNKMNQLEAKENFGYPYGLNIGIKFFMSLGKKWFILMNNDVIVAPDFLAEIKKAALIQNDFALFAPMILYHEKPDTIWFMGARKIPGTLLFTNDHRGIQDSLEFPRFVKTDFVHGCALAVRKDVIETIGLFDDASPIYGDDVDFSWRARTAGFQMAAVPNAKIWHKISTFMQRHKPMTRYLRIRNQIWFYKRYARGLQIPFMYIFTLVRCLWMGIKDLWARHTNLISPLAYGFWDGWHGKGSRKF